MTTGNTWFVAFIVLLLLVFILLQIIIDSRSKIQCQHLHAYCIYGDEIIVSGWRRGYCWQCGARIKEIPYSLGTDVPEHHRLRLKVDNGQGIK